MKKKKELGKTTFDFFVSMQTEKIDEKNTQMTPMRIFYTGVISKRKPLLHSHALLLN